MDFSKSGDEADFDYILRQAQAGDVDFQLKAGVAYCKGRGVEKNFKEGFKWYGKAAENGNGCAACNIGISYYNGDGVELNYQMALRWFEEAIRMGYTAALYDMGDTTGRPLKTDAKAQKSLLKGFRARMR